VPVTIGDRADILAGSVDGVATVPPSRTDIIE
jgi:hypothetical protein